MNRFLKYAILSAGIIISCKQNSQPVDPVADEPVEVLPQLRHLRLNLVEDSSKSIMAVISGALVPLFRPLGLGDWRIVTSLISGFMAKESVVSVLQVLFGAQGGIAAVITPVDAGCLLIFSLLYSPCVAAVASFRRELGRLWAAGIAVWQCVVAWVAAFVFRLIAMLF